MSVRATVLCAALLCTIGIAPAYSGELFTATRPNGAKVYVTSSGTARKFRSYVSIVLKNGQVLVTCKRVEMGARQAARKEARGGKITTGSVPGWARCRNAR